MIEEGYKAIKFSSQGKKNVNEDLVQEVPLYITINNEPFTITMQTPGDEKVLAIGLLYTEGLIKNNFLDIGEYQKDTTTINANLDIAKDKFINSRSLLSVASCGICGKKELKEIKGEKLDSSLSVISGSQVKEMFAMMKDKQHTFTKTGGSHAAAIFDIDYNLLSIKEDIGRHNAVDKVIGDCLVSKNLNESKFLLISGRVSYEIITKCFKARIPILAAVSAPSSLAVDFSKELGITLMGFCREDNYTVYSHPERVMKD